MIELDIESGTLIEAGKGISPTHKIILRRGSETSIFWYLQQPDSNKPTLEPELDHGVVRQLFHQAHALLVGDFLYFSADNGTDYHLHRIASNRFTLKALA